MNQPEHRFEFLIRDLPSPGSARRFFEQFAERNPSQTARLRREEGLFSDVLTLSSYSPLLAATLIQNPEYIAWLSARRLETPTQRKEDLLESLARFALTHSSLEPHIVLARFRRRELLRIFLRDIRRLSTVAEITEEISGLADTILEYAVRLARQEMDNRYGAPFQTDEKSRGKPAEVCVVSLGKLGSNELNYSSDIDLLFIYSADGMTTGTGSNEPVTNREYFAKFAEAVIRLVGKQTGEGAAYRVDMRLRPHGRVGSLALSLKETVRYYRTEAQSWEQQVLIRSRASAGDKGLFRSFLSQVEAAVFRKGRDKNQALREVYLSKEKIDREHLAESAFNVKLGRGGIREIEFIAQALQLAHGGEDKWLRVPHTLISISRLADRGHLTEDERSGLSNAYDLLRRLEHILQMEHGLQTHSLPTDPDKLELLAAKMRFAGRSEFDAALTANTRNVRETFLRVFGQAGESAICPEGRSRPDHTRHPSNGRGDAEMPPGHYLANQVLASIEKQDAGVTLDENSSEAIRRFAAISPQFAEMIAARPGLIERLDIDAADRPIRNYETEFADNVDSAADQATILKQMRSLWSGLMLEIAAADVFERLTIAEVRDRQTLLAEAAIRTAVRIAAGNGSRSSPAATPDPIVFALGKLGSGTLDYGSDLDLVMSYDDAGKLAPDSAGQEIYSRVVEQFVTLLSAMTRDGHLYRVDLRLRPHGKNGPNITSIGTLTDYIGNEASIWELLAYVQIRALRTGTNNPADHERPVHDAIRRRAVSEDPSVIRNEAKAMRLRLERTHAPRGRDIDIKFGPGGLLDIYFVVRYLLLCDPGIITYETRTTSARLDAFAAAGLLSNEDHAALRQGHGFLSTLDHNLRLAFGRSSRLPRANRSIMEKIAGRMALGSEAELLEQLAFHRMNIRAAFEHIFSIC